MSSVLKALGGELPQEGLKSSSTAVASASLAVPSASFSATGTSSAVPPPRRLRPGPWCYRPEGRAAVFVRCEPGGHLPQQRLAHLEAFDPAQRGQDHGGRLLGVGKEEIILGAAGGYQPDLFCPRPWPFHIAGQHRRAARLLHDRRYRVPVRRTRPPRPVPRGPRSDRPAASSGWPVETVVGSGIPVRGIKV